MAGLQEKLNGIYGGKRFNLVAFGLIAVMVLIAYANSFTAGFHFDDTYSIVDNPYIKRVSLENIKYLLSTNRPVVNLTLMLNYQLSGLNVAGWHIFNIAVHIANAFFVYLLIFKTMSMPLFGKKYEESARRLALFGALLFGVHPIQTESVTYIITRTELVATFFYLATVLLFIKGAGANRFAYFIGAFFTSLCAMGSKEWAVTLPAVLFLYDVLFLSGGRIAPAMSRWKAYALIALPWGLAAYTLVLISTGGSPSVGFGVSTASGITPGTYLLTSLNVLWTYVRLLFLPINQNLDYNYPIAGTLFEFPTLLSLVGHIVVVSAAFRLCKKKGWTLIPFGVAWFYITLSPVQSFVPIIDVFFEHRLYLPSIGIFIAFVAGYEGLFDRLRGKQAAPAKGAKPLLYRANSPGFGLLLFIPIVFLLTAAACQRNRVWQDDFTLWADAAKKSPDKARPHCNLGKAYTDKGMVDEAIAECQKALKIKPDYAMAHNNLGNAYDKKGMAEEALAEFQAALKINTTDTAIARFNLGAFYEKKGMINEAIAEYQNALKIKPDYAIAHNNLGVTYDKKGMAEEAMAEFQEALKINPGFAIAHNNLGNIYDKKGMTEEAIAEFQATLKIDPDNAKTRFNLGNIYYKKGLVKEAIAEYQKVSEITPDFAEALNNLAVAYMAQGEYAGALSLFRKIMELQPDSVMARYNIACVYARQGKIEESVDWLKKAVEKGFKDWDVLKTDRDLKNIRGSSYYKKLVTIQGSGVGDQGSGSGLLLDRSS
jgi:tetratricopeptide (TPR) repeat protein